MLWGKISEDSSPGMENIQYSVLALGDTSFNMFCKAGIDWDNRLEALGAKRIYDCVDCDVDFEDAAAMMLVQRLLDSAFYTYPFLQQ